MANIVKSKKTGTKNIDLKLCVGYVAQSRTRFERFLLAWPNRTLYAGQCRFCFDFTIVKCKKKLHKTIFCNGVGWVAKPNVSDGLWICWVYNPTYPL